MSTLILRLAAPLQSWGVDSKFDRRNTGRTPSKSGVLGLCAAALGYKRIEDDKINNLVNLKFGVRIDKPGVLFKDFHMAHEESFWDYNDRSKINRDKKSDSYLTIRYYLSDAVFLVGLEGNEMFLSEINEALHFPMYPLFLGRRCCPPEGRISLGIFSGQLRKVLEEYPRITEIQGYNSTNKWQPRIVMDAENHMEKNSYLERDIPLSFNPEHRKYSFRNVYEFDSNISLYNNKATHDAFAAAEEI